MPLATVLALFRGAVAAFTATVGGCYKADLPWVENDMGNIGAEYILD
ncbi:MAG: hypothetical protein ACFB2W_15625 [Leptolyngbyaceae cyanobacterium]